MDEATPDEATRSLAEHLDNAYERNAEVLTVATRLNMASIACFSLMIILLTFRLIGV